MSYVMKTYARLPISLARGKGCKVWDTAGKEYLDLVAGIAVCNLGHAHPAVVAALKEQSEQLFHCSNIYHIPQQEELAEHLVKQAFEARAFFCNSGAEANEAAIKLVRRYCNLRGKGSKIITARSSFHGRTLGTVAATGQERFQRGFEPIPAGFVNANYGDIDDLARTIDDTVGAVMLEPIQGEGGINVPPPGYLAKVRELCDERGVLLVFDEVQTGMGRTGKLFGYMHEEITPDIMTLAKALGNGFPVGAMLARPGVAEAFEPGVHASTFGGNPLAMACGLATLNTMITEDIADKSLRQGLYLRDQLAQLRNAHPAIREIRGKGLMVGCEFDADINFMTSAAIEKGLLLNVVKGKVIRFVPPLIITVKEIDQAINTIDVILKEKGL